MGLRLVRAIANSSRCCLCRLNAENWASSLPEQQNVVRRPSCSARCQGICVSSPGASGVRRCGKHLELRNQLRGDALVVHPGTTRRDALDRAAWSGNRLACAAWRRRGEPAPNAGGRWPDGARRRCAVGREQGAPGGRLTSPCSGDDDLPLSASGTGVVPAQVIRRRALRGGSCDS